jgi:hypothetical protein
MSARFFLALMLVGFSPAVSAATYSCELQRFTSVQFDKNLGTREQPFEKEVIQFNLVVTADGGEIVAPGVRSKLVRLPTAGFHGREPGDFTIVSHAHQRTEGTPVLISRWLTPCQAPSTSAVASVGTKRPA